MRTRIVQIGNSRGVRIPKPILEQVGLQDEVDLSVEGDRLVIQPGHTPRAGWAEALTAAPAAGEGVVGEGESTRFDREEWTW
ncbi:MAG: AbrB/MazE/SpoVT family DNA-binding domain-containing protein [Gemmatimonadales bacterium]